MSIEGNKILVDLKRLNKNFWVVEMLAVVGSKQIAAWPPAAVAATLDAAQLAAWKRRQQQWKARNWTPDLWMLIVNLCKLKKQAVSSQRAVKFEAPLK